MRVNIPTTLHSVRECPCCWHSDQLQVAVATNKDVGRLDVAVNVPFSVQLFGTKQELCEVELRLPLVHHRARKGGEQLCERAGQMLAVCPAAIHTCSDSKTDVCSRRRAFRPSLRSDLAEGAASTVLHGNVLECIGAEGSDHLYHTRMTAAAQHDLRGGTGLQRTVPPFAPLITHPYTHFVDTVILAAPGAHPSYPWPTGHVSP